MLPKSLNRCIFGLALIVIGSGLFLPNITALFGRIYQGSDFQNRENGFSAYYLAKNLGALLAPIICGFISAEYSYGLAFLFSSAAMFSGVAVFILGKRSLIHVEDDVQCNKRNVAFIYLCLVAVIPLIFILLKLEIDGSVLLAICGVVGVYLVFLLRNRNSVERKNINYILLLLGVVVVFSMFLGQGGTTLNLFIDRIVHRVVFNITIPTAVFYALDPIFMLTVGPLFLMVLIRITKKCNTSLVFEKSLSSLLLLSLGFGIFFIAAMRATHSGQASAFYIVLAYLFFPLSELLLFPTVLSAITARSPEGLGGMVVGLFMLSQAIAAYFMGGIAKFGKIEFALDSLAKLQQASMHYEYFFVGIVIALFCSTVIGFIAIRFIFGQRFRFIK
ncbi:MAG: hypothetical protein JXR42_05685 [Gammaproteobacteria bacterium]|nr:hypothetical protein [Gammaproteobacteria bacterium]